jgi:hypothetical protein
VAFSIYAGGRLPPFPDQTHPRLWISDHIDPHRALAGQDVLTADWCSKIGLSGWGMDGNGPDPTLPPGIPPVGDCGIAGMDHWQMASNAYGAAGAGQSWGTTASISLYEILGGYQPGNAATDQGTVLQANLSYWQKNLIDGNEIIAYGALRPGSWNRAMRVSAMRAFGPLYLGLNFPESGEQQFPGPWQVVPGSPIAGGHCVVDVAEYDETDEIRLVSWGQAVPTTTGFFDTYTEEAWVIIDRAGLQRAGANQYGYDLQGMNTVLQQLTGDSNRLGLAA